MGVSSKPLTHLKTGILIDDKDEKEQSKPTEESNFPIKFSKWWIILFILLIIALFMTLVLTNS